MYKVYPTLSMCSSTIIHWNMRSHSARVLKPQTEDQYHLFTLGKSQQHHSVKGHRVTGSLPPDCGEPYNIPQQLMLVHVCISSWVLVAWIIMYCGNTITAVTPYCLLVLALESHMVNPTIFHIYVLTAYARISSWVLVAWIVHVLRCYHHSCHILLSPLDLCISSWIAHGAWTLQYSTSTNSLCSYSYLGACGMVSTCTAGLLCLCTHHRLATIHAWPRHHHGYCTGECSRVVAT